MGPGGRVSSLEPPPWVKVIRNILAGEEGKWKRDTDRRWSLILFYYGRFLILFGCLPTGKQKLVYFSLYFPFSFLRYLIIVLFITVYVYSYTMIRNTKFVNIYI